MKNILYLFLFTLLFSCKKTSPVIEPIPQQLTETGYIQYTIAAGAHYCDKTAITAISLTAIKFKVKFDSSAIYQTIDPLNQYDINKLYGFSEGYDPHHNSARIGWSWNDGALRLYAYTYNNAVRDSKEIAIANIGDDINCGIKISDSNYVFSVGNATITMTRGLGSPVASGYKLFPYFGGDEIAPADICILIKDLP